MISFQKVNINDICWQDIERVGDANIFQSSLWLRFVAETQNAKPVVAAIQSDGKQIGYFSGLLVRKFGLKILGSPFRGWGSYFMGFNLLPGISHQEVLACLPSFAFNDLGCHYFEVVDPDLRSNGEKTFTYASPEVLHWYALDLTKSEEELFAGMKSAGRNCIRKSIKEGVFIEEAADADFADDYYAQHMEVMKKHGLQPTYKIEFLRKMIEYFLPTGNMLLLRARDSSRKCIATGIFLVLNKTAVFWGAASLSAHQSLRPNESLAWYGIKQMKARGAKEFHFGGECEQYKEKFGCYEANLLRIKKARYSALQYVIDLATSPTSSHYRNMMLRRL